MAITDQKIKLAKEYLIDNIGDDILSINLYYAEEDDILTISTFIYDLNIFDINRILSLNENVIKAIYKYVGGNKYFDIKLKNNKRFLIELLHIQKSKIFKESISKVENRENLKIKKVKILDYDCEYEINSIIYYDNLESILCRKLSYERKYKKKRNRKISIITY